MLYVDSPTLLNLLEKLAPVAASADWDNVGLLLESGSKTKIHNLLLTLDLTPEVAKEAIRKNVDWIITYHPPIFSGLKTLTREDPLTSALLDLLQTGVSVYSPHTALDAAEGGVSDWLCSAFPDAIIEDIAGSGRKLRFKKALTVQEVASQIQSVISAPYLRVAKPSTSRKIKTLGLCPGAGASVLDGLDVDAVFTGEMRHHDILSWQSAGVCVILSEHGHTERPYLKVLQKRLKDVLPKSVRVQLSQKDREPLELIRPNA